MDLKIYFEEIVKLDVSAIKRMEALHEEAIIYSSKGDIQSLVKLRLHVQGILLGLSFSGRISVEVMDDLLKWMMMDADFIEAKKRLIRRNVNER